MQICGYDVFVIALSSFMCYDIVLYYRTSLISLIINWCATSVFYMYGMHDTAYDTSIMASFNR
jgi:hypothetical protein